MSAWSAVSKIFKRGKNTKIFLNLRDKTAKGVRTPPTYRHILNIRLTNISVIFQNSQPNIQTHVTHTVMDVGVWNIYKHI